MYKPTHVVEYQATNGLVGSIWVHKSNHFWVESLVGSHARFDDQTGERIMRAGDDDANFRQSCIHLDTLTTLPDGFCIGDKIPADYEVKRADRVWRLKMRINLAIDQSGSMGDHTPHEQAQT